MLERLIMIRWIYYKWFESLMFCKGHHKNLIVRKGFISFTFYNADIVGIITDGIQSFIHGFYTGVYGEGMASSVASGSSPGSAWGTPSFGDSFVLYRFTIQFIDKCWIVLKPSSWPFFWKWRSTRSRVWYRSSISQIEYALPIGVDDPSPRSYHMGAVFKKFAPPQLNHGALSRLA